MAEAYKRGLLPPDMKDAYEEAQRRGLVGGGASSGAQAPEDDFDIDALIDEAIASTPKPKDPYRDPGSMGGDRAMSGYNALKETGIRGDLMGRAGMQAANTLVGGFDIFSDPGRWVDDAIAKVAPWMPAIAWNPDGIRFTTEGDISEEERAGGLPKFQIDDAKDGGEAAADIIGQGLGFLAPGGLINKGMKTVGKATTALPGVGKAVAAISPKGASAAARGGRYGQRMASTLPEAGVQAATFGAASASQGQDPGERAVQFATDPLSYLAPASMSAMYRTGLGAMNGFKSVTPKAIQREVAPLMTTASDEALAALGDLPMPAGIKEKDADAALGIMHRALKNGGVPDDVMAAKVKSYNEIDGERPAPAVFFRSELAAYPKAIENLDNALYEIGQKAPEVGNALRTMRTSQGQRLTEGLDDTLGKGTRYKREGSLTDDMKEIGEEAYDPIISAGAVDEEAATTLRALLNDAEFVSEIPKGYRTKLSMGAIDESVNPPDLIGGSPVREKIALQQRVQDNPLEVAHKLYSDLGKRIRAGKDPTGKLAELHNTLRDPLFKAGGKPYTDANAAYLAKAKARDALKAPDKLFSQSMKSHEVAELRDDYIAMSPAEKESFKVSLKGLLQDELRRASGSNDFTNLGRMKKEGVLDAIEEILDVKRSTKGTDTTTQIRRILDEQEAIAATDPEVKANRADRLAAGREAYAGKTGAREYTGQYDLKSLGQDAAISFFASNLIPIRAALRGIEKLAARAATPSRSGRAAFARVAMERPTGPTNAQVRRNARAEAARERAKRNARVNGKFAKILDPETPGAGSGKPFDASGFARSMSDDGTPKLPGGGGATGDLLDDALMVVDEGSANQPKRIGSNRPAVVPTEKKTTEGPREMSPAQKYLESIRNQVDDAGAQADEAARVRDAERAKAREEERFASDAEKARAEKDAIATRTKSDELKAERARERALAARERARVAAEEANKEIPPPEVKDGPFAKMGRRRDQQTAKPGDPRAVKSAMDFIVGAEEPAALQANLRRFARDTEVEWYMDAPLKRITDVLAALKGETSGVSPEAIAAVKGMNKANREWLEQQLSNPQDFDLLETMQGIKEMPKQGKLELEYAGTGPIIAGVGGMGIFGAALKGLYDAREKRTPEQIQIDRRRLYGDPEDGFERPDEMEIRQMQAALNKLGIRDRYGKPLTVDGKAGDRMREAVIDFAAKNGLTSNGLNPGGLTNAVVEKLREYYQ